MMHINDSPYYVWEALFEHQIERQIVIMESDQVVSYDIIVRLSTGYIASIKAKASTDADDNSCLFATIDTSNINAYDILIPGWIGESHNGSFFAERTDGEVLATGSVSDCFAALASEAALAGDDPNVDRLLEAIVHGS